MEIKEMLQMLLDKYNFAQCQSLCTGARMIDIEVSEQDKLISYLRAHKPEGVDVKENGFWWKLGDVKSRVEFMNNLIAEI